MGFCERHLEFARLWLSAGELEEGSAYLRSQQDEELRKERRGVTQLARAAGLGPAAPIEEEGLCLVSISETGNWERVPGSGPRKGARPSSLPDTPQNYSDQLPQAPLPRSRTPGRMKQQEGMWSGGWRFSRSKGDSTFSAPWDLSGLSVAVTRAHLPSSKSQKGNRG